jgi:hypothetical protein
VLRGLKWERLDWVGGGGFGAQLGYQADAGNFGSGVSGQAAFGFVITKRGLLPLRGWQARLFAEYGGYAGLVEDGWSLVKTGSAKEYGMVFGGAVPLSLMPSLGGFLTNATDPSDIEGMFDSCTANTLFLGAQGQWGYNAKGDRIWLGGVGTSSPLAFSVACYPTFTHIK